jgi:hypothetical protein
MRVKYSISPTKIVKDITSHELWYKKKPSMKHYKTFNIKYYALQHDKKKSKLYHKCTTASILVNLIEEMIINFGTKSVINSRDVVFKEEIFKVSNEHASTPFTPYMKKDILFTENSSDNDSDNEEKEDDITSNLVKFNDENKDDDFGTFIQNRTNIVE